MLLTLFIGTIPKNYDKGNALGKFWALLLYSSAYCNDISFHSLLFILCYLIVTTKRNNSSPLLLLQTTNKLKLLTLLQYLYIF